MSLKTEAKLSILLACAGLFACNPAAKVEQAQAEQQKVAAEATEQRAELNHAQRDEAAKLTQEQRQERADIDQTNREKMLEEQKEAVKVGTDQMQERARLEAKLGEKTSEVNTTLVKANAELDRKRQELLNRSRERLQKIDARATTLSSRTQTADAKEKVGAMDAMSGFPSERETAGHDIDALASVTAANLNRAEKAVDTELAKLEKKLDRVEDKL